MHYETLKRLLLSCSYDLFVESDSGDVDVAESVRGLLQLTRLSPLVPSVVEAELEKVSFSSPVTRTPLSLSDPIRLFCCSFIPFCCMCGCVSHIHMLVYRKINYDVHVHGKLMFTHN